MIPCTFRGVAGIYLEPPTQTPTTTAEAIAQEAEKRVLNSAGTQKLLAAIDALNAHLDTPSTGKAWKEATEAHLQAIRDALPAYTTSVVHDGFAQGASAMGAWVGNKVSQDLHEIGACLPPHVLRLLAGPQDS